MNEQNNRKTLKKEINDNEIIITINNIDQNDCKSISKEMYFDCCDTRDKKNILKKVKLKNLEKYSVEHDPQLKEENDMNTKKSEIYDTEYSLQSYIDSFEAGC